MNTTDRTRAQLAGFAAQLSVRREDIMAAWRQAVRNDRDTATATLTLSRAQLDDDVPGILDALERFLSEPRSAGRNEAMEDEKKEATEHGMQRWQQGYVLHEMISEWGHLQASLMAELERYMAEHESPDAGLGLAAAKELSYFAGRGLVDSAIEHGRFKEDQAVSRVRELERALALVRLSHDARAGASREIVHGFRDSAGAIERAAELPNPSAEGESDRVAYLLRSQASMRSLSAVLSELLELSRLEAGRERRLVEPFDAAKVMDDMCITLRPLAASRGLFLGAKGPASLPVEGDALKVRRIVENLVLNAVRHTERGGVHVTWGRMKGKPQDGWTVCIRDTGSGFQPSEAAEHAAASSHLEQSAQLTHHVQEGSEQAVDSPSEGIGLFIVKHLCTLLGASLELESTPGKGTALWVSFPIRYSAAANHSKHRND